SQPGEYYVVCCPYCDDLRYQLWINHRWIEYPSLAICYNEDCLANPARRADLRLQVASALRGATFRVLAHSAPTLGSASVERLSQASPPAAIRRLTALDPGHIASAYLSGRGFDLDWLQRQYGIGYCELAKDRRHDAMS